MERPEIRFTGYTDEWEQRKVTDLGEIYIGLVTTMTEHYTDKGHLLIRNSDIKDGYFEFGENPIYLDEEFSEQNKSRMHQLGDVITVHTGDIGTSAVIGENEVNSIGFATIVTRPNQEILDSNYFATYLNTDTHKQWAVSMATGDGRSNYNLKDYTKLVVPIPEIEEQKKIAACIVNINSLITLHQRKCDEVKSLKKYMLQKMFPQNEQKVPEIRFKGFTEAWEQRKLGELYQRNTERNENLIGYDKTISVATMSYKDDGNGASESSLSTYKVIRVGDIAFEGHTNKQFRFGRFVVNDIGTGIMSPRFSTLRPLNEMPVNFWKQYIHSESVMRRILVNSTKAGTMMNELVIPEFLNQTIMVPSENEQAVIGQYFTNIDHLITLHQRKCDEVKSLKKYMLQKMFPQNEQKVPEIRFKGFTEAWEQRKLGELYQRNTERNENLIGYDKTISVATMSYKDDGNGASESSLSTYKVIRVGDIAFEGHTNKQFRFGRFVVNDIGTGIMSPRFSTLRPLNEMPVNFWKQYIHSESVMRRILVNSTKAGTMMNELVIPEFLNQTIMVPSENEQAVIGQYFTNIDHLITLHQQKCEELKKIKKFMLQKMFV